MDFQRLGRGHVGRAYGCLQGRLSMPLDGEIFLGSLGDTRQRSKCSAAKAVQQAVQQRRAHLVLVAEQEDALEGLGAQRAQRLALRLVQRGHGVHHCSGRAGERVGFQVVGWMGLWVWGQVGGSGGCGGHGGSAHGGTG
jgi:hypothetical protein